ncbi:MAG: hypothetical protein P4M11_11005 [Candidatus Pacebacteria bacterium]|nr:hypothetical protein [Candidatus Paceibacterota bacterium]
MDVGKFRVLSMNSMHFSTDNRPENDPSARDLILPWLEQQLADVQTRGKKAILTYHLPHGSFLTPIGNQRFWMDKYEGRLRKILLEYRGVISFIFTAHVHMSFLESESAINSTLKFAEAAREEGERAKIYYGGLVVNRAHSPLFANQPGFSVFHYSADTLDYPQYYDEYTFMLQNTYNKSEEAFKYWVYLYNSRNDLQIPDLSSQSISDFLSSLANDPKKLAKYTLYRFGNPITAGSPLVDKVARKVCKRYWEEGAAAIQMCVDELKAELAITP